MAVFGYGFFARIYVVTETSYQKFYHFAIDYSFFQCFEPLFNQFGGSSQCFRDTARSSAFLDISVLKTTNNLLEEAFIADGNVSTSKVFTEELQSCLENGEEMLGIFLSRPGLACCQTLTCAKTIRPAMQAILEGDSKNQQKREEFLPA